MKQGKLKLRLFGGGDKWARAGVALAVGLVLGVGITLSAIWWDSLHSPQDSVSTTIRNLSILIGGIIAIILTVWRSLVAERQANTAEIQATVAEANVRMAQEQSLNDRYQQAAAMLGAQVLSVRLAGIYALANLSHQYPDKYHVQVVKLLCSFVRFPIEMDAHLQPEIDESITSGRPALRPDIQAALRAIADRDRKRVLLEQRAQFVVDLSGTELAGAELTDANLTKVNLQGANLAWAVFERVDLSHTNLILSNLDHFYLLGSNLANAQMQGSDFSFGQIQRSDLSNARLPSKMRGSEILRSDLSGAEFSPDDLTTLDISESALSGARFGIGVRSTRHVSPTGDESFTDERYFGQITQEQLDKAFADPMNPPIIPDGMTDAQTQMPLVWRDVPN